MIVTALQGLGELRLQAVCCQGHLPEAYVCRPPSKVKEGQDFWKGLAWTKLHHWDALPQMRAMAALTKPGQK
ncbi:hypothetical protein WJX72_005255 [[Myrmecia] bisecta]|uniref:Uncharacterized protein n=1 Tax=[Myrmecia] bisecta TaxID=41462 RepID=A0AAW1PQ26_9CHLO